MAMAMSSASSRTPTSTARSNHSATPSDRDSCYFPGCRKDANCVCEICVESFNATRDLHSALRLSSNPSTLKNHSPSRSPSPPPTPRPVTSVTVIPHSPPMKSTAKSSRPKEKPTKKVEQKTKRLLSALVIVSAIIMMDSCSSKVVSRLGLEPKLATEMVRGFGEEARLLEKGLKERLRIVESRVEDAVGGVFSCSSLDSLWKLNQEGQHFLFQWRCVMYESVAEELSVWGSPIPTSGIVAGGASRRSLFILSGRITEWSEGKLVPVLRMSNGSSLWTLQKWRPAAVQLEGETWVLEYQRRRSHRLFQESGLMRAAWDTLTVGLENMVKKLKWRLLLSAGAESCCCRVFRRTLNPEQPT